MHVISSLASFCVTGYWCWWAVCVCMCVFPDHCLLQLPMALRRLCLQQSDTSLLQSGIQHCLIDQTTVMAELGFCMQLQRSFASDCLHWLVWSSWCPVCLADHWRYRSCTFGRPKRNTPLLPLLWLHTKFTGSPVNHGWRRRRCNPQNQCCYDCCHDKDGDNCLNSTKARRVCCHLWGGRDEEEDWEVVCVETAWRRLHCWLTKSFQVCILVSDSIAAVYPLCFSAAACERHVKSPCLYATHGAQRRCPCLCGIAGIFSMVVVNSVKNKMFLVIFYG